MKFSLHRFLQGLTVALVIIIVFCFWGMFDCINWAVLYGADSFPFPFFWFYLNVYASADILITSGVIAVFILAVIPYLEQRHRKRTGITPTDKHGENDDNQEK